MKDTLEQHLDKLIQRRCWDHAHQHSFIVTTDVDHSSLEDNWLGWKVYFSIYNSQILLHIWRDGHHQGRRHLSVELLLKGSHSAKELQAIAPFLTLTAQFAEDLEADCRSLLGPETGPVSEADNATSAPA